jgi:hypothetical protein
MKIYNREIESWLEKKYHAWKSGKKSKTIDVYYDYDGTYEVKVEFIPQTSLADKPECECEKTSNEWKMYSLNSDGQCIHCGRQISPKQEEIEPSNIDFKSKTDWQVHFIMLENKINEIINSHNQLQEAVNSLKGE